VYISSKHVPSDAPKGKENWYVMINAPENVGQDWKRFKEQARQYIVSKLNHLLKTNIENFIEFEHYMDPRDIEAHTSSFHGSLYGNSSNDKFAAFNRHPNFSKRIKNLYFVGGSVHPGGGIPLCLASAKIVADKIQQRDDF
jgi:phytoene dehydrogenase-like protein